MSHCIRGPRARLAAIFLALLSLVALSACESTAIKTTAFTASESNSRGGVTYYLPMRYAKVTFDRVRADSKAGEGVTKANEALKEKEAALKTAEGAVAAQQAYLAALKARGFADDSVNYKAGQADLIKYEQDVVARKTEVAAAGGAVAKANQTLKEFDESAPMCGWTDSIKVSLLDPVPDMAARYELVLEHEKTRTDHFKIGTTTSGLLKTADAELKDETGEILVSLAKSLAVRGDISPSLRAPAQVRVAATPKCAELDWQPKSVALVIDPSDVDDWTAATKAINTAAQVPLSTSGGTGRVFNYLLALADPSHATPAPTTDKNGILYRRERPLLVEAKLDSSPIGGFVLMVPNGAPADALDIKATSFVTNDYKVGFENGMLVSLDTTRPSETLEVVSVPWKIARATLGIVTELFQLRVDYASDKTALAEQQVKLVQQMQALLEAQRSLDAAKKGEQPASGLTTDAADETES